MSAMANGDQQVSDASSAAFSSNHESAVPSDPKSIASPYPTTNGHTIIRANHIKHSSANLSSPSPKLAGGAHIGQANEPSRVAGATGRVAQVHRPDALGTAHSAPGLHSGEGSHRLDSGATTNGSRAQHSGTLVQTPATAQNGNGTTAKPTSAHGAQTPRPIHASASNPPPHASTPSSGAGHDSATHSRQATSRGSGDTATDEIDGSTVDDLLQVRGVRQGSSSGSTSGLADQHRSGQHPASTLSGTSSPAQKRSRKASGSAEHHIEHTHTPAKLPRVKIRLNHAAAAAGVAGVADGEQGGSKKGQGVQLTGTSAAAPVASGQIQSARTHEANAASTSQITQAESSESTNGQVGVSTSLSPHASEAKPVHNASIGKAPVNGISSHPSSNLSPPTQASPTVPRIVVVKRESPQHITEDSEHTVQISDSTTSVKNGHTTPQDANDTEESTRRKRRRGNTNGSASGQAASGSDMDEDSDSQMADTPLAQAHATHGAAAVSLRPVGKPLISSRDFVPLPPDLSQPSEPSSSSSSMKRTERKIKADPGAVVPDPSLHPTRKPPTQHGTVRPLPLYKPLHAASNGNGDASRANGKAAAIGLGEGPQIPTHHNTPRHPPPRARPRLFDLEEAPVFYPTPEEFADPLKYIQWCGEPEGGNGKAYGIVKVVPPEGWSPDFVLEQEDFRFRTRVQQLNSLSADARASQNYEEQLHKYHAQTGTKRVTIPTVGGKLVDLYQLKLLVHSFGGADAVGLNRKWSEVTRRLDYDEKDAGHLSAQIKRAYMKIIAPFEDFLQANREPRKRSNSAAAKVKAASEDDVAAPAESASASQSTAAMDEDAQDTNDANENDENFEDTHYAETGPGKRRSARRRTETKGAPTTLTVQPTRRRKRKRGASPAHESTQTSSSEGSFAKGAEEQMCEICLSGDNGKQMLLCDECDRGYHMYCLDPPMTSIPNSEWYCPPCLVGTGNDFGFDDGETHSLWSFWQRAEAFRTSWWTDNAEEAVWKAGDGRENGVTRPLSNGSMSISEDDVEREFWRLVHSPNEPVEVEYGADVHSTTHGTALPTREKQPLNPYSSDGWNLNNLPTLEASLLRHIKSDVSGMTVPWLYVGMIFSTFCWHAEDHFTYSINYQHLGDTKTWYGVPGEDADKLEAALRKAAPDLFEQTPDLLFHLTTMISPEKLKKEGVRVYACDQRANEFVITFPKAYHSGFNHGFNFNEAVNFALPDWVPLGLECVRRYQQFGRYPVFSHDQLLVTVYQQSQTIETAAWLREPLREMVERELKRRDALRTTEDGQDILITYHFVDNDFEEEKEYQCEHCKLFCYLGQVTSQIGSQVACLEHAMEVHGWKRDDWVLRMRFSDADLEEMLSKTEERANIPNNWNARLHKLVVSSPNPPLRSLRALLAEGEKASEYIPEVVQLREFVDKANRWTEEAMVFVARRHQKRATAATRESANVTTNSIGSTIGDDSTAELGEEEALYTLLQEADQLPFDAPEVGQLRSVVANMEIFKTRAQELLRRAEKGAEPTLAECKELSTTADNLNVRLDEMEALQEYIGRREWCSDMEQARERFTTLDEVEQYIEEGRKLGMHSGHNLMSMLSERYQEGRKWQAEAESVLGASRKRLPEWTNDNSKYSLRLMGERSVDACQYRLADVERLLKANYEIPIAADLHKPLETLSAKVKDFGKQCTALRQVQPSSSIVEHIDSVERLLQQCSRINVVAEGEAELSRIMAKQDVWTALYEDLINKLSDMCTDRMSPPQMSSSTALAEWFKQCCNRVSKCLDPVDEAPTSHSATLSCVCRTREPIESEAKVTCIRCNCDYHIACLRIPEHELIPNRIKTYVCPFCDVKKLPRLVRPWRQMAVPLKALSEAAISNDQERFPWGVPETKRALDSALARAVHFQDALTSCLSQNVHPQSKAGHALVVHLLKKCFGLPFNLDTPAQRPAASFLCEVLLAHAGFDAEGKPARAIPWKNLKPTDLRYAPDVLPAGSQPVHQGRALSTQVPATRADAAVASPSLSEAGTSLQGNMLIQSTPRSIEARHASAGNESRASMDVDQTSTQDWQGGSVSHDDVTSRDAAFEKDDKKRKRGKRARFVFQEEVGIFVPVQNRRVYCLCRRPEHPPMITCDRCGMWYHAQCVNIDKDALAKSKTDDWMCPMCCVKTERRYPYGELKVKEMGVSDPNSWLDVRCTLRSTTGPISKLSHWTIEESQRIILHLESYYPATTADAEQKADAGNDGEVGKDAANRATSQSSSSASNPSSYALGSVAIDPTWTDGKARVTPLHRTPYEEEMARLRQIDHAKRQEIGLKNLFSRGVTPAMVEKWYIGWNGNELVYPRRDRHGVLSEVPLGTHLELAADDQDGTRVVLAALDREAADLRARGLPVPEFAGPPTAPPLRQVPPPEGRNVHAHPEQPMPAPSPSVPYAASQRAHPTPPPQMYNNHGAPPEYSTYPVHAQPPVIHGREFPHERSHHGHSQEHGRHDPERSMQQRDRQTSSRPAYDLPQIPPYRGRQGNGDIAEQGQINGGRTPAPFHRPNIQPILRSQGEARPSPSSAGPSSSASFASQMRQVPLAPPSLNHHGQPSYSQAPHVPHDAYGSPAGGQYGHGSHGYGHGREYGQYAAHEEHRRPRAISNASSATGYASPGQHARLGPSPSGRPAMAHYSPSQRPRSPPPASARYPLDLSGAEQSSYLDTRPRTPSSHLSHMQPPRGHHSLGREQMPADGQRMQLPLPPTYDSTQLDPRTSAPYTRSPSSTHAQMPAREAHFREMARRMRPDASQAEIDDMVRHALS